mmetsp:Transcript_76316/g.220508  ORF Transcript_76316/g.220508 Transcript_76316/m.220508 type:complete len:217 (-) Transcript_76316:314-964(-)
MASLRRAQPAQRRGSGRKGALHRRVGHDAVEQRRREREAWSGGVDDGEPARRDVVQQVDSAHLDVVHEELMHAVVDLVARLLPLAPDYVLRVARVHVVEHDAAGPAVADRGVGGRGKVEDKAADLLLPEQRTPHRAVPARQRLPGGAQYARHLLEQAHRQVERDGSVRHGGDEQAHGRVRRTEGPAVAALEPDLDGVLGLHAALVVLDAVDHQLVA